MGRPSTPQPPIGVRTPNLHHILTASLSLLFLLSLVPVAGAMYEWLPPPSYCDSVHDYQPEPFYGVAPPVPDLPEQYSMNVQANILQKAWSSEVVEHYDGPNKMASVFLTFNGSTVQTIFNFDTMEKYDVYPNGSCSTRPGGMDYYGFMKEDRNHRPIMTTIKEMFHMDDGNNLTYVGTTWVRGIKVNHWTSCQEWKQFSSRFQLDYYFAHDDFQTSWGQGQIPIRAVVNGSADNVDMHHDRVKGSHVFQHIYDFTSVRVGPIKDKTVFELPHDVVCTGRTDDRTMPTMPDNFQMDMEIMCPMMGSSVPMQQSLRYDWDHLLVETMTEIPSPQGRLGDVRRKLANGMGKEGGDHLAGYMDPEKMVMRSASTVDDYSTGLRYITANLKGEQDTCRVLPLPAEGEASMDHGKALLQIHHGQKMGISPFTYQGRSTFRNLPVDVWGSDSNGMVQKLFFLTHKDVPKMHKGTWSDAWTTGYFNSPRPTGRGQRPTRRPLRPWTDGLNDDIEPTSQSDYYDPAFQSDYYDPEQGERRKRDAETENSAVPSNENSGRRPNVPAIPAAHRNPLPVRARATSTNTAGATGAPRFTGRQGTPGRFADIAQKVSTGRQARPTRPTTADGLPTRPRSLTPRQGPMGTGRPGMNTGRTRRPGGMNTQRPGRPSIYENMTRAEILEHIKERRQSTARPPTDGSKDSGMRKMKMPFPVMVGVVFRNRTAISTRDMPSFFSQLVSKQMLQWSESFRKEREEAAQEGEGGEDSGDKDPARKEWDETNAMNKFVSMHNTHEELLRHAGELDMNVFHFQPLHTDHNMFQVSQCYAPEEKSLVMVHVETPFSTNVGPNQAAFSIAMRKGIAESLGLSYLQISDLRAEAQVDKKINRDRTCVTFHLLGAPPVDHIPEAAQKKHVPITLAKRRLGEAIRHGISFKVKYKTHSKSFLVDKDHYTIDYVYNNLAVDGSLEHHSPFQKQTGESSSYSAASVAGIALATLLLGCLLAAMGLGLVYKRKHPEETVIPYKLKFSQ